MADYVQQDVIGKNQIVSRGQNTVVRNCDIHGDPSWNKDTPWSVFHDSGAAVTLRHPGCSVVANYASFVPDFVSASAASATVDADDFTVSMNHVQFVGDDCVENDRYNSGRVSCNLFDDAQVFLSCLYGSGNVEPDGSGNRYEVVENVVRLAPHFNSYNPPKYGNWRHGGLFKWKLGPKVVTPTLVLRDNVLAVTQVPSYGGTIDLPDRPNVEADGNVLIWLGAGTWPEAHLQRWRQVDKRLTVLAGMDAWLLAVRMWENYMGVDIGKTDGSDA